MDYKQSAKKLAQQGRYGDTMLMHVSPKEVAGLNYLGRKYGAGVTVNPKTGLPEAFSFARLLPMIAGAALAPYTGGATAGLIVGGVETARTGSLLKGAQAGLGAFGGANLATNIGQMGAEQAIAETTAANMADPAMQVQTTQFGAVPQSAVMPAGVSAPTGADILAAQQPGQLESFISQQAGGAQFTDPTVTGVPLTPEQALANQKYVAAASRYGEAATQAARPEIYSKDFLPTYSDIGRGFERLGTAEGVQSFGADLMSDPMQTVKTLGSAYASTVEEPEPYKKEPIDYSKYPQAEKYKRQYRENPNPREDREFAYYDRNALYVNKGGITSLASAASPSPGTYKELIKAAPQASNNHELGQLLLAFLKNQNAQSSKNGGQQRFNVGGLAGGYTDYMRQLQQMVNLRGKGYGANPDLPTQAGTPMQSMGTGNRPQEMNKMNTYKAGGSVPTLEDGGFVLRASTVNGVGNGSSEAGMKYLQAKLGAVPIRGKGDGTKDQIATSIEGRRKALLSNEEAYIPRSVVAQLGNGDINKGAKKLDEFMKKVDKARTGKAKPPKTINPDKLVPKKTKYA